MAQGGEVVVNPRSFAARLQELLFRERDSIGVNDDERCRNEYDSYETTIARWLREGVDEYKLVAHLGQLQRASMGLSRVDQDSDRRVAHRLLELAAQRTL